MYTLLDVLASFTIITLVLYLFFTVVLLDAFSIPQIVWFGFFFFFLEINVTRAQWC